jgi:hypothetical protein
MGGSRRISTERGIDPTGLLRIIEHPQTSTSEAADCDARITGFSNPSGLGSVDVAGDGAGEGYVPCAPGGEGESGNSGDLSSPLGAILAADRKTCTLSYYFYTSSLWVAGKVLNVTPRSLPAIDMPSRRLLLPRSFSPAESAVVYEADHFDEIELEVNRSFPDTSVWFLKLYSYRASSFRDGSIRFFGDPAKVNAGEILVAFCREITFPSEGPLLVLPSSGFRLPVSDLEDPALPLVRERLEQYARASDPGEVGGAGLGLGRGVVLETEKRPGVPYDRLRIQLLEGPAELPPILDLKATAHSFKPIGDDRCAFPATMVDVGDTVLVSVCNGEEYGYYVCHGGWGVFRFSRGELYHGLRRVGMGDR